MVDYCYCTFVCSIMIFMRDMFRGVFIGADVDYIIHTKLFPKRAEMTFKNESGIFTIFRLHHIMNCF